MVNATGWTELMDGNLLGASFIMYNTVFVNWFIAILFFVYQFMLLLKTRNLTLSWITGIIFISLFATAQYFFDKVKTISVQIIFIILVMELAAILYLWFWK